MNPHIIIVPLLGMICLLDGSIAPAEEVPAAKQIKPCVEINGADSHLAIRRYFRITSNELWTRVWQIHHGMKLTDPQNQRHHPLTFPTIDFDNYMVIGIFQGEGKNCTGLTAFSISEEDTRIVFRYDENSYQTIGPVGEEGDTVTAYGFFVLPRSSKPVVIEENVQRYLGKPPIWKERITFPKLLSEGSADENKRY